MRLHPRTFVDVLTARDYIKYVSKDFILDVSSDLSLGRSLDQAFSKGLKVHPSMRQIFVIKKQSGKMRPQLRQEVLFPATKYMGLQVQHHNSKMPPTVLKRPKEIREVLSALADIETGSRSFQEAQNSSSKRVSDFLRNMKENGDFIPRSQPSFREKLQKPGLHRLQHACVLVRTKKAGILIDPHLNSAYQAEGSSKGTEIRKTFSREDLGKIDAILISHFHGDHYHIPTLMMFPKDTLILVPKVEKGNLLCGNMRSELKRLGFANVKSPRWYSASIRVKDAEISVLPFYGEQATLSEASHYSGVWNSGNTYYVKTAETSSWFLVDSGKDFRGSALEVAEHIRKKLGGVDNLLSNTQIFAMSHPFYINRGLNWLTLSADQMTRFHEMKNHIITLGPKDLAMICEAAGAKKFLSYAHWWQKLGARDEGEAEREKQLQLALKAQGHKTKVIPWSVGGHHSVLS